jgi:hypothetical protein
VLLKVGVGVNDRRDITACERIGLRDHGYLRSIERRAVLIEYPNNRSTYDATMDILPDARDQVNLDRLAQRSSYLL